MKFGRTSRIHDVLQNPDARRVIERHLPGMANHPAIVQFGTRPIHKLAERHPAILGDEARAADFWRALGEIEATNVIRAEEPAIQPRHDYENDAVTEGSAKAAHPASASRWSAFEITIAGPSHGNPFTDVELTARFSLDGSETTVGGFYDGDGRWIIRFLPQSTGTWEFVTSSTARSLNKITGRFEVTGALAGEHGPVGVDGFHFAHADGTRHLPIGTTAYAWVHQPPQVRAATLRTLEGGPFSKLRMTVFPKSYTYNANEPELYPFVGGTGEGFDFTRFNPAFFRHLESTVAELGRRGIQADLILFHPYDRWGFIEMGKAADDRYVQYLVRRLSGFPNVWWSMANEYDFIYSKADPDWERLGRLVVANDPARHLVSMHNGTEMYDHSRDWITHASVQRIDLYRTAENVDEWRESWNKPVVVDECCYEGNLEHFWGNISGQELTRRFWEGAVRGGYIGHGETYHRDDEQIWWAKGGELRGDSPARIAFLRRIIEDAPGGILEPISAPLDVPQAGVAGEYHLMYFGLTRPLFRHVTLPYGRRYRVDVIDTWNMTIDSLPGIHEGSFRVDLPGREFMALRITAADAS